jgi:hypothetical protein
VQTLLPRVKKLPIDGNNHWPGEFGKMPTTEIRRWQMDVLGGRHLLFSKQSALFSLKVIAEI